MAGKEARVYDIIEKKAGSNITKQAFHRSGVLHLGISSDNVLFIGECRRRLQHGN